jgi:anti-sigma factor RsiW
MQCERARELLSPYLDGELAEEERRAVAAHIESCRACAALASAFRRIGRTIAESGRERAASTLAPRIRTMLARAAAGEDRPETIPRSRAAIGRLRAAQVLMRQAAVIVAACLLTALVTWWVASASGQSSRLAQDVLSAHVRSLLQESPIQVASSDAHTVKPWFNGRVDFSPEVKDLSADGFPLLGGRLDYVGGRRVGALVYKRHLHTISVFVWPEAHGQTGPPRLVMRDGYNLLAWNRDGLAYWAISDLNADELRQLQGLL